MVFTLVYCTPDAVVCLTIHLLRLLFRMVSLVWTKSKKIYLTENEQHTPFYEKTSDILLHKGKTDQGIQLINP